MIWTLSNSILNLFYTSVTCVVVHILTDNLRTVGQPEVIVTASSQTVEVTHSVMLIARASGVGKNFKYQWQRANHIIKGETKPVLLINNISKKSLKFHTYRCTVSDEFGNSAASKNIRLFVSSKSLISWLCILIL